MLVHVDDLEADFGERFHWALRDWVAVDRGSGVHMSVSHGRRRGGRATRYYVMAPTGAVFSDGVKDFARVFGLTAYSDDEAVSKANPKLEKWLAKGLRYDTSRYEWVSPEEPAESEVRA